MTLAAVCLLAEAISSPVAAQGIAQAEIIVPRINMFTINTSVSVPDRGYTSLGGVRNASTIRNEFAPGFGRGYASRISGSDAGVRVWIHDFQELEEELGKGDGANSFASSGFSARIRQYGRNESHFEKETPSAEPTKPSQQSRELAASPKADHAADFLKRGQDAEQRGKLKVAALYYKSVVSLGATPSARLAQDRLNSLEFKIAGR